MKPLSVFWTRIRNFDWCCILKSNARVTEIHELQSKNRGCLVLTLPPDDYGGARVAFFDMEWNSFVLILSLYNITEVTFQMIGLLNPLDSKDNSFFIDQLCAWVTYLVFLIVPDFQHEKWFVETNCHLTIHLFNISAEFWFFDLFFFHTWAFVPILVYTCATRTLQFTSRVRVRFWWSDIVMALRHFILGVKLNI